MLKKNVRSKSDGLSVKNDQTVIFSGAEFTPGIPDAKERDDNRSPAPVRRTRGPSPDKTRKTKQGIVAAAYQEFFANGFRNTTMSSIAIRSGVSKGALYKYFASKEDLVHEILRMTVDTTIIGNVDLARKVGEPIKDLLARMARENFYGFDDKDESLIVKLMLVDGGRNGLIVKEYVDKAYIPWRHKIMELLHQAEAEGELKRGRAELSFELLAGVFWFCAMHNYLFVDHGGLVSDKRSVYASFINTLDLVFGK